MRSVPKAAKREGKRSTYGLSPTHREVVSFSLFQRKTMTEIEIKKPLPEHLEMIESETKKPQPRYLVYTILYFVVLYTLTAMVVFISDLRATGINKESFFIPGLFVLIPTVIGFPLVLVDLFLFKYQRDRTALEVLFKSIVCNITPLYVAVGLYPMTVKYNKVFQLEYLLTVTILVFTAKTLLTVYLYAKTKSTSNDTKRFVLSGCMTLVFGIFVAFFMYYNEKTSQQVVQQERQAHFLLKRMANNALSWYANERSNANGDPLPKHFPNGFSSRRGGAKLHKGTYKIRSNPKQLCSNGKDYFIKDPKAWAKPPWPVLEYDNRSRKNTFVIHYESFGTGKKAQFSIEIHFSPNCSRKRVYSISGTINTLGEPEKSSIKKWREED